MPENKTSRFQYETETYTYFYIFQWVRYGKSQETRNQRRLTHTQRVDCDGCHNKFYSNVAAR